MVCYLIRQTNDIHLGPYQLNLESSNSFLMYHTWRMPLNCPRQGSCTWLSYIIPQTGRNGISGRYLNRAHRIVVQANPSALSSTPASPSTPSFVTVQFLFATPGDSQRIALEELLPRYSWGAGGSKENVIRYLSRASKYKYRNKYYKKQSVVVKSRKQLLINQ